MRGKTSAIRQARAFEIQPRRRRSAFGETAQYSPRGSLARRRNRALDFAKADAIAIALATAAPHERIAVFEERPLDAAGQFERFGAVPADLQEAAALVL